jgi:hypothetical protein
VKTSRPAPWVIDKFGPEDSDFEVGELIDTPLLMAHYFPLQDNKFRILVLEPEQMGEAIVGTIRAFSLALPPTYNALSYVWGQEPAIHRILVNNRVTLV